MSNLKLLLLAILSFVFSTETFSQSNFIKGYVVLNNHDTLNGYLKQDAEEDLLKRVIFSNSENGSAGHEYSPSDITAFYFNGGNLFELVHFTDINNSAAAYFAKYVLKGYYNLYAFKNKDLQYFIIEHADTTYLLYDDILLSFSGYETKGNYQNQLLFLSRNCGKVSEEIPQLRYSEKDLTAFVYALNKCAAPGNESNTIAVKPKSKTSVYLYAGALPLGDKFEFTGRALVRISTPSISKNLSLNAGLNYMLHKTTGETSSGNKHDYQTDIYSASLTMQNNFTTGIIQPYIEAGIGLSYKKDNSASYSYGSGSGDVQTYGVDFIIAAGIEGYITKNLAIKADWRYELLTHYPVIGIAYFF